LKDGAEAFNSDQHAHSRPLPNPRESCKHRRMASQKRFNFSRAGGLFNRKTLRRELTKVVFEPTDRQLRVAKNWAEQVRHPNFDKARETAVRGEFIQAVLVTLLGYAPYRAGETYTIATEEALGRGAVDTALGTFSGSERIILAPVELKGPKTRDLDAIMPGRNKSPVQQAWNMPSTRRAPNGCLSQIARKSGSTPSAMGASNMRRGIFRLSTTRRSMSGHGSLSAHKISSLAAPPPCSTKARMSKITDKLYVDYKKTRDTRRCGVGRSTSHAKRVLQRRQHRCPCHSETTTDSIDRGLDDRGQRRESLSRGRTAVGYPTRLPRAATHGEKRSAAQYPNL
jgi:hypothetical protein